MREPIVILKLLSDTRTYTPCDRLQAEYRVELPEPRNLKAIETSVLWYTEGKGDEDLGIHFFHRIPLEELGGDWPQTLRFETPLPASPLSYDGVIVRVHWCARVRIFLSRGRQVIAEQPFKLGHVPPASPVVEEKPTDDSDAEGPTHE